MAIHEISVSNDTRASMGTGASLRIGEQDSVSVEDSSGNYVNLLSDDSKAFGEDSRHRRHHPISKKEKMQLERRRKKKNRRKSYANVLELYDGEGSFFYAYDDPNMVKWLGRERFIKVLCFSPCGLQQKYMVGEEGIERLYKCTMMQSRTKVACLYTETEYKHLTREAHIDSKINSPARTGKKRRPFLCVYFRKPMKDKKLLFWHRFTSKCMKYKGVEFLKMYPTWAQSETKEVQCLTKTSEEIRMDSASTRKRCLDHGEEHRSVKKLKCSITEVQPWQPNPVKVQA